MTEDDGSLASHLEALRGALIRCVVVTAALFPVGFVIAPRAIGTLRLWCFPPGAELHYFAPMEAFFVQLRFALVIALALAYPWNIAQIWRFLLPALYKCERRALARAVVVSSLLFACGAAFCVGLVLPAVIFFSLSFATEGLTASLGIGNFASLAGWMTLAFGLMFQTPVVALSAVRFGIISSAGLRRARPYVMTLILIAAGILTPPDVISQLIMAVPTWLLFECGLLFARRIERVREPRGKRACAIPKEHKRAIKQSRRRSRGACLSGATDDKRAGSGKTFRAKPHRPAIADDEETAEATEVIELPATALRKDDESE